MLCNSCRHGRHSELAKSNQLLRHWRRCAKATRVQFGAAGEDFIRVPDFQRFPSPEVLKLGLYLIWVKLPLLLTNYLCSWAQRGKLWLRKKLGKERKENMWWKCWNYVLKSRTVSKNGTMILFWCRWLIFFSSTAFTVVWVLNYCVISKHLNILELRLTVLFMYEIVFKLQMLKQGKKKTQIKSPWINYCFWHDLVWLPGTLEAKPN